MRHWAEPMPAHKKKTVDGDPVLSRGRFVEDDGVASEFVSRIRTKRGSVLVQPTFGSRLHEIKKMTGDAKTLAQKYIELAVAPMIRQRKIRSLVLTVTVIRGVNSYLGIEAEFTNRFGRKQTVSYNHRLGS